MSQLIRDITEIARCGVQYRSDTLAPLGLKSCHASYLTAICDNPGISQDKLARQICINKSNVARQVAALEEEGFVRRCTCAADKRITELYPTEKTLNIRPQLNEILKSWEDCITQDLTEEERRQLEVLLAKVKIRAAEWMEEH